MFSRATILLAATVPFGLGQQLDVDTIGTCRDIGCPREEGSSNGVACRVTNHTYHMVGIKTLPEAITEDGDALTWTVGAQVFDRTDPNNSSVRVVEKDFYLGTPPSLDLTSNDLPYHGCAIIFSGNSKIGHEDGSQDCDSVIGSECRESLLEDAETWLKAESNGTEPAEIICGRIQQALETGFTKACSRVTDEDKWDTIQAVPLTGDVAISPPNSSANASSTCHPTLPRSNDLSFAFGFNQTGDNYAASTQRMLSGVNLIMTLFWSEDKQVEGALEEPASHLTCLWPIFRNKELETEQPSGVAKVMSRPNSVIGMFVFVVGIFFLV